VMDHVREPLPDRDDMFLPDAGCENPAVGLKDPGSDFDQVLRRFSSAEDDFWESLSEGAVGVNHGKAKVDHGGRLEGVQNGLLVHFSPMVSIQQSGGFGRCHARMIWVFPRICIPGIVGREGPCAWRDPSGSSGQRESNSFRSRPASRLPR